MKTSQILKQKLRYKNPTGNLSLTTARSVNTFISPTDKKYQKIKRLKVRKNNLRANDIIITKSKLLKLYTRRQLNNKQYYKQLSNDQTYRNDPRTRKFYTLAKIHKQRNPDRPVIKSVNYYTSKISHPMLKTTQTSLKRLTT